MASRDRAAVTEADIQAFGRQLQDFGEGQLRRITEHFRQDLIFVTENDVTLVLQQLAERKVISPDQVKEFADMEKGQDSTKAAEKLVEYFLSKDCKAGIGLWKSLFVLRSQWSHPNLDIMMEEILRNGHNLEKEIILNETGHPLDPELKACQEKHRQVLYEQSRILVESGTAELRRAGFSTINRYVELKVVSDSKFGRQITQDHEVLAAAGELNEHRLCRKIQVELERISPDRLFRWCPRSGRTPRSVVLSGVAGVGKTTLVQKFVLDWVTGKHYQKFSFVFVFKFRDLNPVGAGTTLEGLLQQQYPELQDKLGEILGQPEKLLFIFDGLDESNGGMDLRSVGLCTRPDDVKGVEGIVASLLKQTLLEGCSVLLTSRPSRLAHLQTEALHRVVVIAGFLSRERQRYFHNFFGEEAVAEKALAHVRESQVLYTLCYNPSYCWITCTALRPCFSSGTGQAPALPRTVTQLFISYVLHMLANHTQGLPEDTDVREGLKNLGWLADYGLTNRMLIFEKDPLDAFHVTLSPLRTAFLVENVRATYSFIHLTVQEFFAALAHYLDFQEENFNSTMTAAQESLQGEYDIFLRFLAGLSHSATRAPLKEHLGEFSTRTTKRVIDNIARTNLKALFSATGEKEKRRALNFFSLLFEAQNSQLVRQVMGDASRVDFSRLILQPVDCVILAYVLSCCRKVDFLNLDSCYVQAEGLQKLSPQLHKIRELCLSRNHLKDSAMKSLALALRHSDCQIKTLSLAKNGLTKRGCEDLCEALSENQSLISLDLSKNKLHDEGLSILLEVFRNPRCKIQKLAIQENALTDVSCKKLHSALTGNNALRHLNLSGNPFTDRCVQEMSKLILTCRGLTEIRLCFCDITPEKEKQLQTLEKDRPDLKIMI